MNMANIIIYLISIIIGIVVAIILAGVVKKIAVRKGYNGTAFWWFGFAAFIPAIIVVNVIPDICQK